MYLSLHRVDPGSELWFPIILIKRILSLVPCFYKMEGLAVLLVMFMISAVVVKSEESTSALLDGLSPETLFAYESYVSENPDGSWWTLYDSYNESHVIAYDGHERYLALKPNWLAEDEQGGTSSAVIDSLVKRHINCLNRNQSLKCQGCGGKFLNYSSAHNCNGKAVSCCTPQKGSGYGCVCYTKAAAQKQDLGSAGCCSSQ